MYPYINTSMLRERFVITESDPEKAKTKEPVIALGNRIVVSLKNADGKIAEHMIVRGHNMHCVARVAARVFLDFDKKGTLLDRIPEYDWDGLWANVCSTYENEYNPANWIAVYYKGRQVYSMGEHHPFLDVMEQCDAANRDEYDQAIILAEEIFKKAGKAVKIDKDTNIATVVNVADNKARCGLIMRGPQKSSTFSFSLDPLKGDTNLRPQAHICLNMSAAYLEAIQLAFKAGQLAAYYKVYNLSRVAPERLQSDRAKRRIGRLNAEIKSYENRFDIRYRPERPDVFHIMEDTESRFYDIYAEEKAEKEREEAITSGKDDIMVE